MAIQGQGYGTLAEQQAERGDPNYGTISEPVPSPSVTAPSSEPNKANAAAPIQPSSYTIAAGDTLSGIAQKYGTNIQAILGLNPSITNPNQISAGSQIKLPGIKQITTSPGTLGNVAKATYAAVQTVPDQTDTGAVMSAGTAAGNAATQPDPLTQAVAPFIAELTGLLQETMSPQATATSLSEEYQNLAKSSGLTALNTELMNMQNVMNGSEDDIRNEITAGGGFADDSQVMALTTARNTVLMKKYNTLQAQQAAAQDFVTNTMQYATADQSERDTQQQLALSKINDATGIVSQMSTLEQQMMTNARTNYQGIVNDLPNGLAGLAGIVSGDPYHAALAESALGLPSGSLTDPTQVQAWQSSYDRASLITAAKAYFTANGQYPSWAPDGIPVSDPSGNPLSPVTPSGGSSPTDPVTAAMGAIVGNESGGDYSAVSPVIPSGANAGSQSYGKYQVLDSNVGPWTQQYYGQTLTPQEFLANPAAQDAVAQGRIGDLWNQYGNIQDVASVWFTGKPASESGGLKDQATGTTSESYIAKATAAFNSAMSPSTPGTSTRDATVQAYADGIKNGTITSIASVPAAYKGAVATLMDQQGTVSPLADSRFTMATNRIVANYIDLPGYTLTANGLPYLERIAAAEKTPGSISDQDLLDSLTKLNTAGNAISDAQVKLVTDGQSYSDWASVLSHKLSTGGVLSTDQRTQIETIAKNIYSNYAKSYQPIYDQVTNQLTAAGIPNQYWTIPNLNALYPGFDGSSTGKGDQTDSAFVESSLDAQGLAYNSVIASAPSGQIPVVMNDTGAIGYIPADEFNASTYTKL